MSDQLLEFGFELVVVDEAHSFKNTDSQRAIALTAFLKTIERSSMVHDVNFTCPICKHVWVKSVEIDISSTDNRKVVSERSACSKCGAAVSVSAALHIKVQRKCQIILLTGTPIKNRASEYFVPLNLVAPELFPSKKAFERRWLDGERINPYRYDEFKRMIAPYVLRREKEDVYKDVPKLNRIFTHITIEDERLKKAYNACLDRIEATANQRGQFIYFQSIGELQVLRQICGLAKVQWISDYVETFLADSEREKLAIGYHHHSVRDALRNSLDHFGTMKLDGEDSPQTKDRIAHKDFELSNKQILLLGMQAAKEGLELVYISNAIVAEREWSSAEEEKFEFRFYNPDLSYLAAKGFPNKITTIEYIIAQKTIDGFFYDMVENKRAIFGETISNNWSLDTDQTSFQQLCEQTLGSRL
jgi:SNF2 family DNA or RNA helicase